jgi:6-phosphogluconolactonase (cycloisomerase 2 family)
MCGGKDGLVFSYRVGPDGALTLASRIVLQTEADSLGVDPRGHFAYVYGMGQDKATQNATYEITPLSVGRDGKLALLAPTKMGHSGATPLLVDPKANRLYAGSGMDIEVFSIANDGSLATAGTVKLSGSPQSMVLGPKGRMLYTANYAQGSISVIKVSE